MVKKVAWVLGWCAWITFCYLMSKAIVVELFRAFGLIGTGDTLINTILTILVYAVMFAMSYGGARLAREYIKLPKIKELAGMARRVHWKDLGQAIIYIALYLCVLITVMMSFRMLFPELANEEQNLGYSKVGNNAWQLALIFMSLVIIVPVVEELIMRGLLFGRLRSKISFWPTAIIVSLLFALAHGQINVGIDVFILSLFLCYVREKTGAIYAPIFMHSIKNLLGFITAYILVL